MSGLIKAFLESNPIEGNILVESSSLDYGPVHNPIIYNSEEYFRSIVGGPGEWWQVSLLRKPAVISSYKIKTYYYDAGASHPKSWALSGSNDNETFTLIDLRIDDNQLNAPYQEAMYPLQREFGPFKIFRFSIIRSHNTDPDYQYRLVLNQFDIYGHFADFSFESICQACFPNLFSQFILLSHCIIY